MIKRANRSRNVSRREVLRVASAGLAATALAKATSAEAAELEALIAETAGRLQAPQRAGEDRQGFGEGRVRPVHAAGTSSGPSRQVASNMLEKALTEYTPAPRA